MSEINLIFEIHCKRPPWAIENPIDLPTGYQNYLMKFPFTSRYRVYINDDLITERTWVWNNNTFLKENIWINSSDNNYILKIEPVVYVSEQAKFVIDNLHIIDKKAEINKIDDLQVNFTLR
jgi:hypothetical protein